MIEADRSDYSWAKTDHDDVLTVWRERKWAKYIQICWGNLLTPDKTVTHNRSLHYTVNPRWSYSITCTSQWGLVLIDSSITIDLYPLPPIASTSLSLRLAYLFEVLELLPFTNQVHKAPFKTIRQIPQEHPVLISPHPKIKRQRYYDKVRKVLVLNKS